MFDVVVFGTATQDVFCEGVNFARLKNPIFRVGEGICLPFGSKIEIPRIVFAGGGVGTNAAVSFSRQGLKTAVVCRLGYDVSGEEIIRELKKEKIETKFIQKDLDASSAYSVIFLTKSGERTILSYKGAGEGLTEKEISWAQLKTKWFYVGSLGGNEILLREIFSFAKKNKIKIAGNPGGRELKILKERPELLNNYDVFIVNQEESSYLTDISYQKESEVFRKLDEWVRGIVAMTKGAKGAAVSDGRNVWQAGIFPEKKVVDRTGAGDGFGSGFAAGLAQKPGDLDFAVRLASANATSVVEHIGAKKGILSKIEFESSSRWEKLAVKKIPLKI